ncbi:MAG: ADP-ribosylglycohydrolase family protein [Planctomycetota bacterium]
MAGWTTPYHLLALEFTQRADEGCVIPSHLRHAFATLHPDLQAWDTTAIDPIYDALMELPEDAALAANEPNELAAIRALRPDGPRDLQWKPSETELIDRLHGAWVGRASGCALGKPVEGMGMSLAADGSLAGRKRIKSYLEKRGHWPLTDYFSGRDMGDELKIGCPLSQRENIAFMEADDDIHYSLVGLGVLEEHGPTFTWDDVARYWLSHIPIAAICTAEAQSVLNFQNNVARKHGTTWRWTGAATASFCRRNRNPYREWIGAQIRSDGWAFCCAGRPEQAAEFAYRDACWTHERNGIYGEMLFAAMQAAAFVEHDPRKLTDIGLSEIPRNCRLAAAVRELLTWIPQCATWEACMDRIEARWPDMSAVHTINNALICIMALFYGKMDTLQTQAIAVMGGLDTDCNGATVGSIVGAAAGRQRFRDDLAKPLNDTIKPQMLGFQEVRMRSLAERSAVQWQRCGGRVAALRSDSIGSA